MRTCIEDEKLLPALNWMLPLVCIVCQSPMVAMMALIGSAVAVVGVVGLVVVVSGRAAFLAVPHAVINAAKTSKITMLFFIIGFVVYFALQQFVVRFLLEGTLPLFDGLFLFIVEPQDVAIVFQQVVVLILLDGALDVE